MADLGSRTNLDTAIDTLLDDAQPNEAIQPSDHNTLLKNALDTVANGLPNTLRTNPETGGQDLEVTSGDNIDFKNSGFVGALTSGTLTGNQTYTLPDNTGTIALTSDIGGVLGISDSSGNYTFYDTFALAIAGASSGDTIQLFANITETTDITVTCVDGVNINFNGYTYTLNTAGTSNAFTVGNNVSLEMYNGKIKRIGGTSATTSKVALRASGIGVLTLNSMILENDFGNAGYFSSLTRTVKGGDFVGESLGVFVSSSRIENAKGSANSGVGLQIQNNGIAINCYGFSTSSFGVYNNNSQANNCIGRSNGNVGLYLGNGESYNCQGFSTSNYGANITGSAKFANIFGFSSASAGVNVVGVGTNITGYSTASYGVRYSSGSGDHVISNVKAFSTSDVAMYVLKNAGKVEFTNIDCATTYDDAGGHALLVAGSDDDIIFSGGSLRVENASANCINASSAKNCYFVGLKFNNSTTAINANITNLQSNTPDSFGNILIG